MSVTRLPSGKIKVRWRDGLGHRAKTFAKNEMKEARAFEQEVSRAKRLGYLPQLEAGKHTLGEVAAEWWASHNGNIAPRTRDIYNQQLQSHVLPTFDNMRLGEISPATIEAWLAKLDTGPRAKQGALGVLNQICNFAVRAGYRDGNPCVVVKRPKRPAREPINPPTPTQVETIRKALFDLDKPGDAYLISVLAYAGLRPHETWWLDWTEIRDRTILARSSKTGRHRAVKMLAPLAADLAAWKLSSFQAEKPVFPTSTELQFNKNTWDNWRNRVWSEVAPKGMRPYDLRHAAVSLWLRDPGISRMEAATWAGHSMQVQDDHYAHLLMEGTGSAEQAIRAARQEVFGDERQEAM